MAQDPLKLKQRFGNSILFNGQLQQMLPNNRPQQTTIVVQPVMQPAAPADQEVPAQPAPPWVDTNPPSSRKGAAPAGVPQPQVTQLPPGQLPPAPLQTAPLPGAQVTQLPGAMPQGAVVVLMPAGWQPQNMVPAFAPRQISPEVSANFWPTRQRNPFGNADRGMISWSELLDWDDDSGEPQAKQSSRALFAVGQRESESATAATESNGKSKALLATAAKPKSMPASTSSIKSRSKALISVLTASNSPDGQPAARSKSKALFTVRRADELAMMKSGQPEPTAAATKSEESEDLAEVPAPPEAPTVRDVSPATTSSRPSESRLKGKTASESAPQPTESARHTKWRAKGAPRESSPAEHEEVAPAPREAQVVAHTEPVATKPVETNEGPAAPPAAEQPTATPPKAQAPAEQAPAEQAPAAPVQPQQASEPSAAGAQPEPPAQPKTRPAQQPPVAYRRQAPRASSPESAGTHKALLSPSLFTAKPRKEPESEADSRKVTALFKPSKPSSRATVRSAAPTPAPPAMAMAETTELPVQQAAAEEPIAQPQPVQQKALLPNVRPGRQAAELLIGRPTVASSRVTRRATNTTPAAPPAAAEAIEEDASARSTQSYYASSAEAPAAPDGEPKDEAPAAKYADARQRSKAHPDAIRRSQQGMSQMRPYTYPQAPADQRPQPEYIPPTPPAQAAKKAVSPLMRPLTALGEMTKLPKFVTNAVRDPAAAGPAYDDPHALATAQRLRARAAVAENIAAPASEAPEDSEPAAPPVAVEAEPEYADVEAGPVAAAPSSRRRQAATADKQVPASSVSHSRPAAPPLETLAVEPQGTGATSSDEAGEGQTAAAADAPQPMRVRKGNGKTVLIYSGAELREAAERSGGQPQRSGRRQVVHEAAPNLAAPQTLPEEDQTRHDNPLR
jgi:hypothetical protein